VHYSSSSAGIRVGQVSNAIIVTSSRYVTQLAARFTSLTAAAAAAAAAGHLVLLEGPHTVA